MILFVSEPESVPAMRIQFISSIFVLFNAFIHAQFAEPVFRTQQTMASSEKYFFDYNADGHIDILVGCQYGSSRPQDYSFSMHINDGLGNFEQTWFARLPHSTWFDPDSLIAYEWETWLGIRFDSYLINDDEARDIVLWHYAESIYGVVNKAYYLLNNGDGTFTEPVPFPDLEALVGNGYEVLDFDLDGRMDLMANILGQRWIVVHENFDTFSEPIEFGTTPDWDINISQQIYSPRSDLDGDGDIDLYKIKTWETGGDDGIAYVQHLQILTYENLGNFSFNTEIVYEDSLESGLGNALNARLFRYNSDALDDFIVIRHNGESTWTNPIVNQGNIQFNYVETQNEFPDINPSALSTFDYNDDGRTDIFKKGDNLFYINNESDNWPEFALTLTNSQFDELMDCDYEVYHELYDLNGDGMLDWIYSGDHVRIILKDSDFNYHKGDRITFRDPQIEALADLNADSVPDFVAMECAHIYVGIYDPVQIEWVDLGPGRSVDVADINADGYSELLIRTGVDLNEVQLWTNSSGSLVLSQVWSTSNWHNAIASFVDLDNDNDPDIVSYIEGIWSWLENSNGEYLDAVPLSGEAPIVDSDLVFEWYDVEGDGDMDFYYLNPQSPYAGILLNEEGAFTSYQNEDNDFLQIGLGHFDVFDFNHDGIGDFTGSDNSSVHVAAVNSDFTINTPVQFGALLYLAQATDLNSDGLSDIVAVKESGILNTFYATSPGVYEEGASVWFGVNDEYGVPFNRYARVLDWDNDGDEDFLFDYGFGLFLAENLMIDPDALYLITGQCYLDVNTNGTKDEEDLPLPYAQVTSDPETQICYTNQNGYYWLWGNAGTYDVTVNISNNLWVPMENGGAQTVSIDPDNSEANINFGFVPDENNLQMILDASLNGGDGLCDNVSSQWLTVHNEGNMLGEGVLAFTLDSLVTYIDATPAPDSIVANTLWFHFDNLMYYDETSILINAQMPGVEEIGNYIENTLVLYDISAADTLDTDSWWEQIDCSYDPNLKITLTGWGEEKFVLSGDEIEYLIQFQNTGTAPAQNVTVLDNLLTTLDETSLNIVAWSHPFQLTIDEHLATFLFENIMLPDSAENEPASHGFVRFTIHAQPNLAHLTAIENNAEIYFDNNPPIITPFALNTILDCNVIDDFTFDFNSGCPGTYVLGNANSEFGEVYSWTIDGEEVSSGTNLYTALMESGEYEIVLHVTNPLCDVSSEQTFIVHEVVAPVITMNDGVFSASGTGDFQWMMNDMPIDGATNSSFTPTEDGNYTVSLLDENGCYSVSETIEFVGVAEISEPLTLCVVPNPVTDQFTITFAQSPDHQIAQSPIIIYDMLGNEVLRISNVYSGMKINVQDWNAGVYMVRFSEFSGSPVKLVKT